MVTSYEVSASFLNLLVEVATLSVNRILVINPGSTSTKIGVFDNERPVLEETIRHDVEQIGKYKRIIDQYEFRKRNDFRSSTFSWY